jgi:ATP-dependent Clp protease ATP-binding subunit ClpA
MRPKLRNDCLGKEYEALRHYSYRGRNGHVLPVCEPLGCRVGLVVLPDEKPFDMATTHVLCRAGELANEMQSNCVQSHHVFLALLHYQEGREDDGGDSIAATATKNNEVWQMLLSLGVPLTNQKTALDVCKVLVTNLNKQNKPPPKYKAETPNLDNLGVDFTKKARLGLLDVVHGRDMEIGAALRTLMRRRKNNVVLIGEAGVGTNIIP